MLNERLRKNQRNQLKIIEKENMKLDLMLNYQMLKTTKEKKNKFTVNTNKEQL